MATKCKSVSQTVPSQQHHCMYDTLLEKFLPVIHKAAHSVSAKRHPDTSGDLLLAGLRGFKEAFLQLSDLNHHVPQEVIVQTIYVSMRQELEPDTLIV